MILFTEKIIIERRILCAIPKQTSEKTPLQPLSVLRSSLENQINTDPHQPLFQFYRTWGCDDPGVVYEIDADGGSNLEGQFLVHGIVAADHAFEDAEIGINTRGM